MKNVFVCCKPNKILHTILHNYSFYKISFLELLNLTEKFFTLFTIISYISNSLKNFLLFIKVSNNRVLNNKVNKQ